MDFMSQTATILVIDDEPQIRKFLRISLASQGYKVLEAGNGAEGLASAALNKPDVLVLDLGLPDMDGLAVLRELRATRRDVPVVILTARDGVHDTVAGLEGGADDYVTKPFRFEELLARIRARLRSDRMPAETVLTAGGVSLDLRTRQARVGDGTAELSAREFALAEMFFRHPGQVLSRQQLLSHVWGYDFDPGSNVVDVYVGYLRRKLGKSLITSVRGMGYRLERDSETSDL